MAVPTTEQQEHIIEALLALGWHWNLDGASNTAVRAVLLNLASDNDAHELILALVRQRRVHQEIERGGALRQDRPVPLVRSRWIRS